MSGADASPKKMSTHIPVMADQGIDHVTASPVGGQGMQAKLVTQSGAAPLVVDLEALGLKKMADTDYVVISQVEGKACTVDESTKTQSGFNVLVGADTDVHNLLVVGRFIDQAPAE
jgi:hypothetical protein